MNPTLYDILGVPEDADRDEIKRAWRDAADRFEPGTGGGATQFRMFNEAAEVLLDPQRRAEYDAQVQRQRVAADAATGSTTVPEERTVSEADDRQDRSVAESRPARRGIPLWALAVLGVVTTLAVLTATAVSVGAQLVGFLDFPSAVQAEAIKEARTEAPGAAERAAVAVLSYDHESLESDRDKAARFLTDEYRSDYVKTFNSLVSDNATETKAKVEAKVVATSVASAKPDRASVLLFVNQTTTSTANDGEPQTALNRVVFDMRQIDGTWLVDDITSY